MHCNVVGRLPIGFTGMSSRCSLGHGTHINQLDSLLYGMPTIQHSAGSARLYLIGGFLGPPVLNANGISIASAVFAGLTKWQTDRPTNHATRSVTIWGIYVRSTVMWSNNNCSISGRLDWFLCFCHRTEQGNRRQQTWLRPRYGIARLTLHTSLI